MNRRNLLKTSLTVGAAGLLPLPAALAQQQPSPTNNDQPNAFKRFMLGDLELTILTDGFIRQSPVHPFVAPLATAAAVQATLEAAFRPTDAIELGLNVMLVKSNDRLVLLDTGMGLFAAGTQGWLAKNLAAAGFRPSDFTDVILSHGHTDHIGGLVDKQDKQVFANAAIHMDKKEYDFWLQATIADFKNSPLFKMADFVTQTISQIQRVLQVIKPQLKFIDTEKGLYDLFSFQLAPGHTPGLTLTTITSKNEKLVFIADLIHSDALLFAHPEWGFIGDTDLRQAVASRKKVLQELSATKTRTFAYHLPWPGLGHVRTKGAAFEWVPDVYATP